MRGRQRPVKRLAVKGRRKTHIGGRAEGGGQGGDEARAGGVGGVSAGEWGVVLPGRRGEGGWGGWCLGDEAVLALDEQVVDAREVVVELPGRDASYSRS